MKYLFILLLSGCATTVPHSQSDYYTKYPLPANNPDIIQQYFLNKAK